MDDATKEALTRAIAGLRETEARPEQGPFYVHEILWDCVPQVIAALDAAVKLGDLRAIAEEAIALAGEWLYDEALQGEDVAKLAELRQRLADEL